MGINFVDTLKRYDKALVEAKSIDVVLWKNDYKYVQAVFNAEEDGELSFELDKDIEVFALDETLAFIGSNGYKAENPFNIMPFGPKVKVADIVNPYEKANFKKGDYKAFLFKIKSNKVGKDNLVITVSFAGKKEELTINREVLDLDFPDTKDYTFTVEYWQHPYNVSEFFNVPAFSDSHIEYLKANQKLYKDLGGSGVTCTILDEVWGGQTYGSGKIKYPSMVTWTLSKGEWLFDYTILDKWVELNKEVGLSDKFICYSMMPWGNRMRYFDKDKNKFINRKVSLKNKKKYTEAWSVFLADFVKHLDEKGWFDDFYIGFDERVNMLDVLDLVAKFKNKDGKNFKVSASFNNYLSNKECLDRIDSAAVGLYEVRAHEEEYKKIVDERRSLGKKTLLYTATDHYPNSFTISLPAESYWTILYALASHNDGFLRWAYDAWTKNPFVDTTHSSFQAGDCFLIYPGPRMSFRMVELDEGVRDANKLNILKQKGLANEVEVLLQGVWKDYTRKCLYKPYWGVSVHKNYVADEKATIEICEDVKKIKEKVVDLARKIAK